MRVVRKWSLFLFNWLHIADVTLLSRPRCGYSICNVRMVPVPCYCMFICDRRDGMFSLASPVEVATVMVSVGRRWPVIFARIFIP
jgi:hypothetical protein